MPHDDTPETPHFSWPEWAAPPPNPAVRDAWRPFLARNPRLTHDDRRFLSSLIGQGVLLGAIYDEAAAYYADGPDGPIDDAGAAEGYGRITDIEHLAAIEQGNLRDREDDSKPRACV
jgi:hypothetical protein